MDAERLETVKFYQDLVTQGKSVCVDKCQIRNFGSVIECQKCRGCLQPQNIRAYVCILFSKVGLTIDYPNLERALLIRCRSVNETRMLASLGNER